MNGDEDGDGSQSGEGSDDQSDTLFTFSAERDQLFQLMYGGYDLYDQEYLQ